MKKRKLLLILPFIIIISSCSRDKHGVISSKLDIGKQFEEQEYYAGITQTNDTAIVISEDENDWKEKDNIRGLVVYPNPFNPDNEICIIELRSHSQSEATITIFKNPWTPIKTVPWPFIAGLNRYSYDGTDDNGNVLPEGIYRVYITNRGNTTFGDINIKRE